MELSVLNELFKTKYPGGKVGISQKPGCLAVTFETGGRVYHYRSTIVDLAEQFGLIPEFDFSVEAERIVAELRDGNEAIGPLGIMDAVRIRLTPGEVGYLRSKRVGHDEFGRSLVRIWASSEWDPWLPRVDAGGK